MVDPKFIGKTYKPVKYEVGLEKIKEYAIAIMDTNPLYVDEEAAKKSKYGGIIAPPTFAVVYTKDAIGQLLFDKEMALNFPMLVHGEQEFEFYDVVRPGDVIWTECKVANIFEKDGNKDFVVGETISKRDGKVVCKGLFTFIIRR